MRGPRSGTFTVQYPVSYLIKSTRGRGCVPDRRTLATIARYDGIYGLRLQVESVMVVSTFFPPPSFDFALAGEQVRYTAYFTSSYSRIAHAWVWSYKYS